MRKLYIGIMALIVTLALVACADGDRSGGVKNRLVEWYELSPEVQFDTETPVTITFWHRMGAASQNILKGWIQEFKTVYPNITVIEEKVASDYGGLVDKVALSLSAGIGPDLAESYPDHVARYAQSDAPLALNYFISHPDLGYDEEELADFLPSLWAESTSYDNDGTILSMPFSKSSEGFFYNKTYFDAHTLNGKTYTEIVEEDGLTWEKVFAIAEDIKAREPEATPFGYDSDSNFFITASEQYGAPYTGFSETTGRGEVLFNNEKSMEMIKYFKDKVDKGLMVVSGAVGDGFFASDIMKTNEKLYMYVGSTGGTRYAYENAHPDVIDETKGNYRVGVTIVPAFDGENPKQIQQGPNLTLFKKDNEQQMIATWLFTKFITSAEKSAQFAAPSGYAPIRYSSYESDFWQNHLDNLNNPNKALLTRLIDNLVVEAINLFLDHNEVFFTSPVFGLSSKSRDEVGKLVIKIMVYNAQSEEDLDAYIREQYQNTYDFVLS